MRYDLKQGDVFCSDSTSFVGKAINWFQKLDAKDDESIYSHSGIITSMDGDTFEALSRIERNNIYNRKGQKVIIARPLCYDLIGGMVTDVQKKKAISELTKQYNGMIYPFWRLGLHMIPFMAKKISANGRFLVCSELVAKYLYLIGARHSMFTGTSPDDLADEWGRWRNFEVIYEGIL
jgi:hypothetical protein